jgi:hypothetical protein
MEWLDVRLEASHRYSAAELVEQDARERGDESPTTGQMVRMLRAGRDELLLDREQGRLLLGALNRDGSLPALRARLEAFFG